MNVLAPIGDGGYYPYFNFGLLLYCDSLCFSQTFESVYYSFDRGVTTDYSTPTFSQTTVINHVLLFEGAESTRALPVAVSLILEHILLGDVASSQFKNTPILGLHELFLPNLHHFTGGALGSSC